MSLLSVLTAALYSLIALLLAVFGLNMLLYTALYLLVVRGRRRARKPVPEVWPTVTVQLPVYNERLVIERLIDAVAALDYPRDRLTIQVLDDSTDDTLALARMRADHHRQRGVQIEVIHRSNPTGHKAGALAAAWPEAAGEFIAVFDADFVPGPDFLQRLLPYFDDPQVGMVQARWGHLNAAASSLTRSQALALDGHHVVEQAVRSRLGALLNFNGSAGIWRRACVDEAGGWQADTLAEDLDLSYRAQLAGWQMQFVDDVIAPAEIPPRLQGFKRQQFRWAKGSIQVLRKLAGALLRSSRPLSHRLLGLIHLSGYLAHPLMVLLLLLSLPLLLLNAPLPGVLGLLSIAGLGAPLIFALSQWAAYPDWLRRVAYLPLLVLLGIGVAVNNTGAVLEAVVGRNPTTFLRTPKFARRGYAGDYELAPDWSLWGEALLAVYGLVTAVLAFWLGHGMAPFLLLYAAGFAYTAGLGWREWRMLRKQAARLTQQAAAH